MRSSRALPPPAASVPLGKWLRRQWKQHRGLLQVHILQRYMMILQDDVYDLLDRQHEQSGILTCCDDCANMCGGCFQLSVDPFRHDRQCSRCTHTSSSMHVSTGPMCAGVHHASGKHVYCCHPVQWTVLAVVAFALAVLVYTENFGGGSGEPQPLRRPRGGYHE